MRRALAVLGLILAAGGFVLLAFSMRWGIHFMIPVGMIIASFLILIAVRRMPSDVPDEKNEKGGEEEK